MTRRQTRSSARGPRIAVLFALLLIALGPQFTVSRTPVVQAADNPVVTENQQPGTEAWQLYRGGFQPADDFQQQIKGYASAASINKGESLSLQISVNPPQSYTIDIYRIGWYEGKGGRLMRQVGPLSGVRQPACPTDATTGMISCAWTTGHTLTVPADWTSGIYLALLTNAQNYQSYIPFVVRDDARPAALLYQQPVLTYQAYNNYPDDGATGKSLYDEASRGAIVPASGSQRAVKVSFDRPYSDTGFGELLYWEIHLIRWLERSGYDVAYSTNLDTHSHGERLLNARAFISPGHDQYWTGAIYDAVEAARDSGVDLGFFGANDIVWQVRLEDANRVVVGYRGAADPVQGPTTTGLWRDQPLNRPAQGLLGVQTGVQVSGTGYRPQAASFTPQAAAADRVDVGNLDLVVTNTSHWAYALTGFTEGALVPAIAGYQVDRYSTLVPDPASRPNSRTLLADSPVTDLKGDPNRQHTSIYQAASGAWVFAAGTTSWSWALDRPTYVDARIQRVTKNILDRFLATETQTAQLTVTTTGGGSVTPGSGTYTVGATASFTATADPGNIFLGWTVDGLLAGWGRQLTLPVNRPQTIMATFAPRTEFPDVPPTAAAYNSVGQLAARGIIRGYADGMFGPTDATLRAQMAALIARAMGWDGQDWGNEFTDRCDPAPTNCVGNGGAGEDRLWINVGTLRHYGVANGYGDGTYGPRDPVLNAQVISFITRAMVAQGYWHPQADDGTLYPNVTASSGHRRDLATFVHYAGTVRGTAAPTADFDGWDQPSSRAWFAFTLWQALDSYFGK